MQCRSVPPPSLDAAIQTHDVTKIDHPTALPDAMQTLLKAFPDAMFHTLPRGSPLFPVIPTEYTDLVLSPENKDAAISDLFLLPALHQARLIKDEAEIVLIRKANEISSRAHEVVMRVLGKAVKGAIEQGPGAGVDRPLLPGEWLIEKEAEAEAIFVASCRREGYVAFCENVEALISIYVVLYTKHTCLSSQHLHAHLRFTTAVMTANLHGDLSIHTTIITGMTLLMVVPDSSTPKSF